MDAVKMMAFADHLVKAPGPHASVYNPGHLREPNISCFGQASVFRVILSPIIPPLVPILAACL